MAKEEIPRGQLSLIILSTLSDNDKYGYEIMELIKEKTFGKLNIKQPSLYSSLRRMQEQGLISSYWRDSEIGGRRHYYSTTDYGKKYAEKWQADYDTSFDAKKDNFEESNSNTVLQQESLFSNNSPSTAQNVETQPKQESNDDLMQFDLFSMQNNQNDINKLRQQAEQNNIDDNSNEMISNLRNIGQTEQHTQTNSIDIQKTFFELKRKQKSFLEAIKDASPSYVSPTEPVEPIEQNEFEQNQDEEIDQSQLSDEINKQDEFVEDYAQNATADQEDTLPTEFIDLDNLDFGKTSQDKSDDKIDQPVDFEDNSSKEEN